MADPKTNTEPTSTTPVATLTCTHILTTDFDDTGRDRPVYCGRDGSVVVTGTLDPDGWYSLTPVSAFNSEDVRKLVQNAILAAAEGDK